MKTELSENVSLVRRFLRWCRVAETRRISKFAFAYTLFVVTVIIFDYIWMPYLAIKFQYLAFFPLYLSLFVVCMLGLGLCELFKEDIFLREKMKVFLNRKGKYKFTRWVKEKINANPRIAFVVISLENPLQAYIYFRQEDKVRFTEVFRLILIGSFCCAFFWSIMIDIVIVSWNLGRYFIKLYL